MTFGQKDFSLKRKDSQGFSKKIREDAVKYVLTPPKIMLEFLCLWPDRQNFWTKAFYHFMFVNLTIMGVAHVGYLVINIKDLAKIAWICTTISTTFQALVKSSVVYYNAEDLRYVLKTIRNDYWSSGTTGSKMEKKLSKDSFIASTVMCSFLACTFFACFLYMARPMLLSRRILPLESAFPFDWEQTPYYEFLYLWHWLTNSFYTLNIMNAHDFLFVAIVTNTVAQFRMLSEALKAMGKPHQKILNQKLHEIQKDVQHRSYETEEFSLLVKCVRHHLKIVEICYLIEKIFTPIILFQFVVSTVAICVSSFAITVTNNFFDLKLIMYFAAHVFQLFYYCYYGDDLIARSLELPGAAYSSLWENHFNKDVRGGLVMLIQYSQRGRHLTAGGFARLNFSSFVDVMKLSFSVYTMLDSFKSPNNAIQVDNSFLS